MESLEDVAVRACLRLNIATQKISLDNCDKESALYWRCFPLSNDVTLTQFCSILALELIKSDANEFVTRQLLLVAEKLDRDEAGVKNLIELLWTMVEEKRVDAIGLLSKLLHKNDLVEMVMLIIKRSKEKVNLANALLMHVHSTFDAQDDLISDVVLPALESKMESESDNALKCLGLCCLHDLEKAQDYLDVFAAIKSSTAVEALADIGMVHGLDASAPLLEALEDASTQRVAAEALAKLLHGAGCSRRPSSSASSFCCFIRRRMGIRS